MPQIIVIIVKHAEFRQHKTILGDHGRHGQYLLMAQNTEEKGVVQKIVGLLSKKNLIQLVGRGQVGVIRAQHTKEQQHVQQKAQQDAR